jgi:uncharacterized protein (TIGR02266 family)
LIELTVFALDHGGMSESRKSPRVNAPLIIVKIASRERMKSSYLKDLSEGGLFIRAEKVMPVGRELMVDLLPPGWQAPIRLSGTVVRVESSPQGMGLKFEDNDEPTRERLRQLLGEYEAAPAAPATTNHQQQQLMHLLDRYSELQDTLVHRDAELVTERTHREDAVRRAAELSAELEIVTLREAAGPRATPRDAQLEAELAAAKSEQVALIERVGELEGLVAEARRELEQSEADDGASRKLAAGLAKEKGELVAEVARLTRVTAELNARQQEVAGEGDRLHAELERTRTERDHSTEALQALRLAHERAQEQAQSGGARVGELTELNRVLQAQVSELSAMVTAQRGTLSTQERRLAQLETANAEGAARLEKARLRERELRELLAMVAAKGDDAVVVSEDEAPTESPAPLQLVQQVEVSGEVVHSSPSLIVSLSSAIDHAEPEAPPAVLPAPQAHVSDADLPVPLEALPPSSGSAEIAVEIEETPDASAAPTHEAFERRVRSNERLRKSARFVEARPGHALAQEVWGYLDAAERFAELMVLCRGKIAPPQLMATLVELLEAGAVELDDAPLHAVH